MSGAAYDSCFRPRVEPARAIYDAFQKDALNRPKRGDDWIELERLAVWRAARDWAMAHALNIPTLDQIKDAEISASGHVDYGAKWAYRVADLLLDDGCRDE